MKLRYYFFLCILMTTAVPALLRAETLSVETLEGNAILLRAGESVWQPVATGMSVGLGDRISVEDEGIVEIKMPFGMIELSDRADVLVKALPRDAQRGTVVIELNFGMLKADHAPAGEGVFFELHTPNAVSVTDHGFLSVWVYPFLSKLYTRLDVFRGQARFSDTVHPDWLSVAAGQHITAGLNSDGGPKAEPFVPGHDTFILKSEVASVEKKAASSNSIKSDVRPAAAAAAHP